MTVTSGWSCSEHLHGLFTGAGEPDHLHVALPADQHRQALADDAVVVDAEDADGTDAFRRWRWLVHRGP